MLVALYISALLAWSVALAWHDFRDHRLPDRLTLPAIPVALAVLAAIRPDALPFAVIAAVTLGVLGLLAHRVADLGFGDVKLLPSVGIIASNSVQPAENFVEWFVAMSILGGIHAAIHLIATRDRHSHIPFGPSILSGLLVAECF